jgi:hypothetical protein
MPTSTMIRPSPLRAAALAAAALAAACGNGDRGPAPTASGSAPAPSSSGAPPGPDGPPSPLHVVLESKGAIAFSGLEGGVWIGDAARAQVAQAAGADDLAVAPMPAGLAEGPGRILRASGRLPRTIWVSFEKQKEDGKPEATPLYRLTRGAFSRIAEDWQPQIAPWSKGRLLAASTSSGKLKIKVLEPQTDKAPPDLPGTRLDDASCEEALKLRQLAALPTGEVFAAGNCKPDRSTGTRYVVIRWVPPDAGAGVDAGTGTGTGTAADAGTGTGTGTDASAGTGTGTDAGAGTGTGTDAGTGTGTDAGTGTGTGTDAGTGTGTGTGTDAGAGAPVDDGRLPGTVSVMPDAAGNLTHRALHARSATEVYAAATGGEKGAAASRLFRFDGAAWISEPLPPAAEPLRALSGTTDGTLWLTTEHEVWKRPASGAWERVPLPARAFAEADGRWEIADVWAEGGDDVWIAARYASPAAERHVVLRLKPPKGVVRWP